MLVSQIKSSAMVACPASVRPPVCLRVMCVVSGDIWRSANTGVPGVRPARCCENLNVTYLAGKSAFQNDSLWLTPARPTEWFSWLGNREPADHGACTNKRVCDHRSQPGNRAT